MSEPTAPRLLVLDTSVAAKWYLPEELREEALELSARVGTGEVQLLAPSIIGPELFNALYQQHRRGYLSLDEVRAFFSSFRAAPVSLFEIDPLNPRAAEITLDSGVVVYDALFLALAEGRPARLLSPPTLSSCRPFAARPTLTWRTTSPTSAASSPRPGEDRRRTATVLQPG